jgi:CRISPR/Cas system-associated exonuclease Cas4 (RecB family)
MFQAEHNAGSLIGKLVHQVIQEQIQTWVEDGNPTLQGAQARATTLLSAYYTDHGPPDHGESESSQHSVRQTIKSHLKQFFTSFWPQLNTHHYISHEETHDFSVAGETVIVRPDFVTRDPSGEFVVTDWKTNPPAIVDPDVFQLHVYGLWAYEEYEPDLDRIQLQFASTSTGGFTREQITHSQLDTLRSQIHRECSTWNQASSRSDFEPDPAPDKCRRCSYLDVCDPGREIIPGTPTDQDGE